MNRYIKKQERYAAPASSISGVIVLMVMMFENAMMVPVSEIA
jgi:hypothetical protein